MYNSFTLAFKYLRYYLTAANGKGHGVHPPFIFDFIETVLQAPVSKNIEAIQILKKGLLHNNTILKVEDFGAGSTTKASNQRSIKSIAKHAAKPHKYAIVLHNIIKRYGCKTIIELGTSLGISSAYMAVANTETIIITCEGSPEIATAAKQNFETIGLTNIAVLTGEFSTTLPQALAKTPKLDLFFIDGNHQYQPTIDYFKKSLPHLHNDSIIVFDDIHWSADMEKAWDDIKQMPQVSETIDLFFIGIVFLRKEQKSKQHFIIRY